MSRLRLRGVHVTLGDTEILRGVDLDIDPGTLTAILGPSGCGKTTLLRVIAGFAPLRSGSVELDGQVLAAAGRAMPPESRGIALVPQESALFPHLDVAGNVAFGLARCGRRAPAEGVAEMLALVGLGGFERARPHELSGGQQQRVALARALAPRPRVVLLDEPFAALDASLRGSLRTDVRAALAASGATAVLVTHDQDEALSLADSVAVMLTGRIVAHDTPAVVYGRPPDLEVARFVGNLVELPAIVRAGRAETVLGALPLGDGHGVADGPAVVGIRPEQLRLGPAGEAGPGVPGLVRHREFFGHDALVHVELPGGERVIVRTLGDPPPGEEVRAWVSGPVHAFVVGGAGLEAHESGNSMRESGPRS